MKLRVMAGSIIAVGMFILIGNINALELKKGLACKIVLPSKALLAEKTAAKDLKRYLSEATGATPINEIEADGWVSDIIPLGFSFTFCNISYNQIYAASDGWITFNTSAK